MIYAMIFSPGVPERVLNQAERMNVPVSEADTFDGPIFGIFTDDRRRGDAKDLTMPFPFTKDENGWHLAFISRMWPNYVQENSALDRDGKRGTSVYLADRVILCRPMLPPMICSLNEGLDRLALS